MKTLILDIETSPHANYNWSLFDQRVSIDQIIEESRVLCFAAKWHGQKKITFVSEWEKGGPDRIANVAHSLLDEADLVVSYNGIKFDIPRLKREMVIRRMSPPSPHKDIDLLKTAKTLGFASNKLGWVAQQLGASFKMASGGFKTWTGVLSGDTKARRQMRRYNIHDVVVTEQMYDILMPWIKGHPVPSLYSGDDTDRCPCGSESLERRGYRYTAVARYQRYRCKECGRWLSSGHREHWVDVRSE